MADVMFDNTHSGSINLYISNEADAPGCCYFWYPGSPDFPTIKLKDTWEKGPAGGCYIFTHSKPTDLARFAQNVQAYVHKISQPVPELKYFVWVYNPDIVIDSNNADYISVQRGIEKWLHVSNNSHFHFGQFVYLTVGEHCIIKLDESLNYFTISGEGISFRTSPEVSLIDELYIPFSGLSRGCFRFTKKSDGFNDLFKDRLEFRYWYKDNDKKIKTLRFSVFDKDLPTSFDLQTSLDPLNQSCTAGELRTYFAFSSPELSLPSNFKTVYGRQIFLQPRVDFLPNPDKLPYDTPQNNSARLVFTPQKNGVDSPDLPMYIVPKGDYGIYLDHRQTIPAKILCGLSGTETIICQPGQSGDCLRFYPNSPAYSPVFPLQTATPLSAPVENTALLSDEYLTAWINVISAADDHQPYYISQPEGAVLYGQDRDIYQPKEGMLGYIEAGQMLGPGDTLCFPMVPLTGAITGPFTHLEEIRLFEQQIITARRKQEIAQAGTKIHVPDAQSFYFTTPQGIIIETDPQNGYWKSILIGINDQQELKFNNPHKKLQQAFQTNQLFLVASASEYLPGFQNQIGIENWNFNVNIGSQNRYGSYTNVMILKFCTGKITDLVQKTGGWNQAEDFNPKGQLPALAQWLKDYIQAAITQAGQGNKLFDKFQAIVQDENWNGVLFLAVDIAGIPSQLDGFTAGVDMNKFKAHHFGLEKNKVMTYEEPDKKISIDGNSSMFGLINYVTDGYESSTGLSIPAADCEYDFKLNELVVLFENTKIKHFASTAQLTLNRLLGSKVSKMGPGGNYYNSIVLKGSYQHTGSSPSYQLTTANEAIFIPDTNILNKMEILSVGMSTLKSAGDETTIQFDLRGFMDFAELHTSYNGTDTAVDLFSFGSTDGLQPQSGLRFSHLHLLMTYQNSVPGNKTFQPASEGILFDIEASTIRPNSLYRSFALELAGMESGPGQNQDKGRDKDNKESQDATPAQRGYLNVITDLRLTGVDDGIWNGLKFRLNMGSPGELAGKAGLNADLLLAWSAASPAGGDYKAAVGIRLPGVTNSANLISIQNVLKLSYGPIRLIYALDSKNTRRRFMLLLTDIALKFMGLAKIPPDGNTVFYLFGNPKSDGKPSGLGWYAMYKKKPKAVGKER